MKTLEKAAFQKNAQPKTFIIINHITQKKNGKSTGVTFSSNYVELSLPGKASSGRASRQTIIKL